MAMAMDRTSLFFRQRIVEVAIKIPLLLTLIWLAIRFPETPRRGVLGIMTTRGDRLFISLLGSAFINLAWVGLGRLLFLTGS